MSKVETDLKIVNAEAKFGVLLTSEEAMEDMAAWVKANGLVGEVATWSPGGKREDQLMISSLDEFGALSGLIRYAETLEHAEVIRRLTLEDLAESLELFYEYVAIKKAHDAKNREFPVLFAKISGGGIAIRQILDHGIRKNARVLTITLSADSGDGWSVESYAITQYETNPDGIEAGEEQSFLVSGYEQPEDETDERSKFDRTRDAVIDYRITGGRGSKEWIAGRVESSVNNGMDAKSAEVKAIDDLNDAYRKFSPVLHAMSRMAVVTADTIYPIGRGRYQDKPYGQSMADKFAALIK